MLNIRDLRNLYFIYYFIEYFTETLFHTYLTGVVILRFDINLSCISRRIKFKLNLVILPFLGTRMYIEKKIMFTYKELNISCILRCFNNTIY